MLLDKRVLITCKKYQNIYSLSDPNRLIQLELFALSQNHEHETTTLPHDSVGPNKKGFKDT